MENTARDFTLWGSQDTFQCSSQESQPVRIRSSSYVEGTSKGLEAVMKEFRMNGTDSPWYDPEENTSYGKALTGMGPASAYLRQKSWPAPEKTPAVGLPQPGWQSFSSSDTFTDNSARFNEAPYVSNQMIEESYISEQQIRVLHSLPNAVLYPLLRQLALTRLQPARRQEEQECRFCKNNGERESYYRSHTLRVAGRVTCPVLRAFVCRRCGARGDNAHTLKHCPMTSAEERSKSAAMMRSLRQASTRRRKGPFSDLQDFVVFGETTPSVIADGKACSQETLPLDPLWAALEQKLKW